MKPSARKESDESDTEAKEKHDKGEEEGGAPVLVHIQRSGVSFLPHFTGALFTTPFSFSLASQSNPLFISKAVVAD